MAWRKQIAAEDTVFGPYADFAISPIHERDIAAVAAQALMTDGLAAGGST
jgi:hypothetical protein